jgi:uncharacterized lipoprotein YddW (UPF0748 family)
MTARSDNRRVYRPLIVPCLVTALAVALFAVTRVTATTGAGHQAPLAGEVRGLWVGRGALTSPESIAVMVREAKATGINTLFVQVRGRGEAFYRSRVEPRASDLAGRPLTFDPLAETLTAARTAGLRVHAWINVNLVSSASRLPEASTHIARRHPEWLMVPRALAPTLAKRSPRSREYLTALTTWTTRASERVEGLYLSPLVPAAQAHTVAVVEELARDYALDGIHLDYIRFPGPDFDYAPAAIAEFRRLVLSRGVPRADRDRLDREARRDPTTWTRTYASSWTAFREERLASLVHRLRAAALAARPGLVISAAVVPDHDAARREKLQDWGSWADAGVLDAICPMIYTTDAAEFETQFAAVRARVAGGPALWAGIGAYRLPPARTAANVRAARHGGAAGVILFSYEQLSTATGSPPAAVRDLFRAALLEPVAWQSP